MRPSENPGIIPGLQLAEGVGFEPTEAETRLSGLANRRTRPDYATLPWCQRGDSNPHALLEHNALNVACLPIPPLWHVAHLR